MRAQREKKRLSVVRNKNATSFTGYVTYELKDKENPWNKTTHMLARYAEYANIGGNKTAAYGQVMLSDSSGPKSYTPCKFDKNQAR